MNNIFQNSELISSYSRATAIEDGVLIDVSDTANEAGIKWPTAVTTRVWDKYIDWTEADNKRQTYQDLSGRLWDVISMLAMAMRSSKAGKMEILYKFYVIPRGGRGCRPKLTILKAVCSPGDNLEPTLTIMLPNED